MDWRKSFAKARERAIPVFMMIAIIALAVAILWFTPNRTAGALIGLFAAGVFTFVLLRRTQRVTQSAILWFASGVVADAAYAKLNDQVPVTIAGALMKIVDAVVKLADTLMRSAITTPVDTRAKIGAVTPDFVWAFILGVVVFLAIERLSQRKA